jgi:hypothetical protein
MSTVFLKGAPERVLAQCGMKEGYSDATLHMERAAQAGKTWLLVSFLKSLWKTLDFWCDLDLKLAGLRRLYRVQEHVHWLVQAQ